MDHREGGGACVSPSVRRLVGWAGGFLVVGDVCARQSAARSALHPPTGELAGRKSLPHAGAPGPRSRPTRCALRAVEACPSHDDFQQPRSGRRRPVRLRAPRERRARACLADGARRFGVARGIAAKGQEDEVSWGGPKNGRTSLWLTSPAARTLPSPQAFRLYAPGSRTTAPRPTAPRLHAPRHFSKTPPSQWNGEPWLVHCCCPAPSRR